ncbi:DUF91 domain-containing protein [Actinospica sp. MGRD01-02]|uniref:DUF91 domain-containing protein n=1 Tax=Actinospica acidithermotolerans TaxID=2828514 RepID=A0A941EA31_9ACTN|nr:endonuclease NucS domain-containing protein [Actinospica acidithermotolerans]MBR7826627.1 DUF91 domain-containing protein [Actinospica acidithermotolerans]
MAELPEHKVRDLLAANLHILETGLRLVRVEFPLANDHGARGSIDILARDRHGMYVIIEVKRANSSAREALHEVAKYSGLLAARGIDPVEIRAIIVSTTWHELRVAFSAAVRSSELDLRGFELSIDTSVEPPTLTAHPIAPLPAPRLRPISGCHLIFICQRPEERAATWRRLHDLAKTQGIEHMVAVDMTWTGPAHRVVGKYALYLALAEMDYDLPHVAELAAYATEFGCDDEQWPAESEALARLVRDVRTRSQEMGSFTVFASLLGSHWHFEGFRGTGLYREDGHLSLMDVVHELAGTARSLNPYFLSETATPSNRRRWMDYIERVRPIVAGCGAWELLPAWLSDAGRAHPNADFLITVNNPLDLVSSVIHGYPDRMTEYAPMLKCQVFEAGQRVIALEGALVWNGRMSWDLHERIDELFGGKLGWAAQKGDVELEQIALEIAGLRHAMVEVDTDGALHMIEPSAEGYTRVRQGRRASGEQALSMAPLHDFYAGHRDVLKMLWFAFDGPYIGQTANR